MARLPIEDASAPGLSRRGFIVAMSGGVLACGFPSLSTAQVSPGDFVRTADATSSHFEPTMWFSIDGTGAVTVNITRAEMGQHVGTALARIIADELEVAWERVRIVHVDTDPKWGYMVTGGSWSVWQTFPVFSQAGAAGRIALVGAAAQLMSVGIDICVARDGVVTAGERSVSYAEIVSSGIATKTFTEAELKAMPIKPVKERRLIGKPVKALDIAAKTTGAAVYGLDAKIENMVYGAPVIPPTRYDSVVVSVDDSAAKSIKGYMQAIVINDPSNTVPGWVIAIADTYWAARRAADAIHVVWKSGPSATVSEKDILDHAHSLIADKTKGAILKADNIDTERAFTAAASMLEQTYINNTVLHFQLEPVNALAFERDGIFEVHSGNQWQSLILPTLAKALGRSEETIVIRSYLLGGGFGRRLNGDYMVPAVLAAKVLERPVKLVLTREDDVRFDSVRSAAAQTIRMAFDADKNVVAMEHHACAGWPTEVLVPAFMPKGANDEPFDPFAISGADHWYDVGAHKVRAISNDLASRTFRPGWLRSVGPGWTNWASENFIDEAAHLLGEDPVAFRLRLLTGRGANAGAAPSSVGGASRLANVLRIVAERGEWGQQLPKDTGLGIAVSFGQERDMPTWTGCAARLKVDRQTGIVAVERLTVVVDAGTIIDPDGARAQVEGAALWGLSMALHEGTEFMDGQVVDRNLDTYTPLRISDVPVLDVTLVDSGEVPVGLGEPATTVIAPAIANAIFNAVGVRLRQIPIRPDAIKRLLQSADHT